MKDIFIHPNRAKKVVVRLADLVNCVNIMKKEDLENFLENINFFIEINNYKI